MAKTETAPKLRNERKEREEAKAQADQALIDARALAEKYNLTFNSLDTVEDIEAKIQAAKDAGVIPNGKAVDDVSNRTLGVSGHGQALSQAQRIEDIEISSEEELHKYQDAKKLIGFGGWVKNGKPSKNENGEYGFVPGAKAVIRVALMLLLAISSIALPQVASADTDGTEESVMGNRRFKITSSGHLEPVTDSTYNIGASGAEINAIYVDDITIQDDLTVTDDLTFQTSLLAGGRYAASSTIPSSSNGINPSTLPYSVLTKSIGNVAGETATLPAGRPGQLLVIHIIYAGTSGTWTVTLGHSAFVSTLLFNATGDSAALVYDETMGWIVMDTNSVTVTYK